MEEEKTTLTRVIGSFLRTWIAVAAGSLVGAGAIDPVELSQWIDLTSALISGVVVAGGVQLWSLFEKFANKVTIKQ